MVTPPTQLALATASDVYTQRQMTAQLFSWSCIKTRTRLTVMKWKSRIT